jgi:hypothetical protein
MRSLSAEPTNSVDVWFHGTDDLALGLDPVPLDVRFINLTQYQFWSRHVPVGKTIEAHREESCQKYRLSAGEDLERMYKPVTAHDVPSSKFARFGFASSGSGTVPQPVKVHLLSLVQSSSGTRRRRTTTKLYGELDDDERLMHKKLMRQLESRRVSKHARCTCVSILKTMSAVRRRMTTVDNI